MVRGKSAGQDEKEVDGVRLDPAQAARQVQHELASLLASFAVAMTMLRFSSARAEANRTGLAWGQDA